MSSGSMSSRAFRLWRATATPVAATPATPAAPTSFHGTLRFFFRPSFTNA
jgi:hypothetical protein